jgi:hypothetical protein
MPNAASLYNYYLLVSFTLENEKKKKWKIADIVIKMIKLMKLNHLDRGNLEFYIYLTLTSQPAINPKASTGIIQ